MILEMWLYFCINSMFCYNSTLLKIFRFVFLISLQCDGPTINNTIIYVYIIAHASTIEYMFNSDKI